MSCCPACQLTAECTDNCVLVACDEPHSDQTCDFPCQPCSEPCVQACDGCLDELMQCCADYPTYLSHPIPQPETSLFDLLCKCDSPSQTCLPFDLSSEESLSSVSSPNVSDAVSAHHMHAPRHAIPYEHQHLNSHPATPSQPHDSTSVSSQVTQDTLTCQWALCNASFLSLADLVRHVNIYHLRLSPLEPSSTSPTVPQSFSDPPPSALDLSCHWGTCTTYPTSSSIPGPSTARESESEQVFKALGVLASHLFEDHLGLVYNPGGVGVDVGVGDVDIDTMSSASLVYDSASPYPSSTADSAASTTPTSPSSQNLTPCDPSPLTCLFPSCNLHFPTSSALTEHIESAHIPTGKGWYECLWEGCERKGERGFGSRQKVRRHLQTHTGHRPFPCPVCNQNFSEAATLQQHMRRHTMEKPYVCDHPNCGKSFSIAGALTIHKRTHNGDKPFRCAECGRTFAESSNLSKHIRTHTGARPYTCPEPTCGKSFARPDQLTRHAGVHRKSVRTAS